MTGPAQGGLWPSDATATGTTPAADPGTVRLELDRHSTRVRLPESPVYRARSRTVRGCLGELRQFDPVLACWLVPRWRAPGLVAEHPDDWGDGSPLGKRLTAQRLGRMLATSYGINSTRMDRTGPRGYTRAVLLPVWYRMGVLTDPRRLAPVRQPPPKQTGASGASGSTGVAEAGVDDDHDHVAGDVDDQDHDHESVHGGRPACTDCGAPLFLIRDGRTRCTRCDARTAA